MTRYHKFKQHDGRGWGILRQDEPGSTAATIIDANLPEADVTAKLKAYRREEPKLSACPRCENEINAARAVCTALECGGRPLP